MNCATCGGPMHLEEGKEYLTCDFCKNVFFPEPDQDGIRMLEAEAPQACPICHVPLIHAAACGFRILACGKCRGLLVPMDVFVAMVEDLRSRSGSSAVAARPLDWKDLQRKIQCPVCGRSMDTHPYCGPGAVIIDDCSACHLNWLDYGELRRIVSAPDRHYGDQSEAMI